MGYKSGLGCGNHDYDLILYRVNFSFCGIPDCPYNKDLRGLPSSDTAKGDKGMGPMSPDAAVQEPTLATSTNS